VTRLQVRPLDGFSRAMAQTTRSQARVCLLGVRKFRNNIQPLKKSPQSENLGQKLVVVVVNAKPARAVALLLGDHDSSRASTDPPGGFHCPSGPDRSISLVAGPDDVSTGRWVVDQRTGRRGLDRNWTENFPRKPPIIKFSSGNDP